MAAASTPDVSIVTSGHDVADARLHRICAALVRAGLQVEVLGLGDAADAPAGVTVHTSRRGGMTRRAARAVRYAVQARGRVLVALDPDSLVTSLLVARVRSRRVAADVHEDYASLLRDRAWARGWRGRAGQVVAGLATAAARACDLVVVADAHVPPLTGRHRMVVRNVPDLTMLPPPSPRSATPRALYVGDVRGSRGLWAMLDAIEGAPGWVLDVVGPVAAGDEDRLARELTSRGLADRMTFHGRQPPALAWKRAEGAWCGLTLLEDTTAFRAALPSKLYEYVGCGLAVVVTALPRQRDFVLPAEGSDDRPVGAVVAAGDSTGAAAAELLRRWSGHPDELDELRAAALERRERLLEENPYAELARELRTLATPRR